MGERLCKIHLKGDKFGSGHGIDLRFLDDSDAWQQPLTFSTTPTLWYPFNYFRFCERMHKARMQWYMNQSTPVYNPACKCYIQFIHSSTFRPRLQFHDEFVPGSPGITRSNLKERKTNQWPLAPLTVLAPFTRVPFVPA